MRYIDEALATMVRWKLSQKPQRNEGYILDGYPKTVKQASLTFIVGDVPLPDLDEDGNLPEQNEAGGGEEEEDAAALMNAVDDKLLPEYTFVFDCNEDLLKERVDYHDPLGHRGLGNFYKRLADYKKHHNPTGKPHKSTVSWLRAILTNKEGQPRDMCVVPVDVSNAGTEEGKAEVMNAILRTIGEPHYYRPTPEMIIDAARQESLAQERAALKAIRAEEEAQKAAAAAAEVKRRAEANHKRRYTSIEEEQRAAREMNDLQVQEYLMRYIVPAVTRSMQHVVALRPEDPVDVLGDILFNYKSKTQL